MAAPLVPSSPAARAAARAMPAEIISRGSSVRGYELGMATVKKGVLTPAVEWWNHLRWMKRAFWKRERAAARAATKKAVRTDD